VSPIVAGEVNKFDGSRRVGSVQNDLLFELSDLLFGKLRMFVFKLKESVKKEVWVGGWRFHAERKE
jgi:hypothetical protein